MTKYAGYQAERGRVSEAHPELATALATLEQQQDAHFEAVVRLLTPAPGDSTAPIYDVDLILLSVLNRSLDLLDGFLYSYQRWNLSTAAPVVRMQVDNLLRLSLLRVGPAQSVIPILLKGTKLNSELDPLRPPGTKYKLTDERLRHHASPLFPWLDEVYMKSSGWVHFSSVHIAVTFAAGDDGAFSARFPSDVARYPKDFLEQVLWAMNEATSGVLAIVDWFANGKRARTC